MKITQKLLKEVKHNFMGSKITREGNSNFWGTDDLHQHCIGALEKMNTYDKLRFLIEQGYIEVEGKDDLGGDPVNPYGEP